MNPQAHIAASAVLLVGAAVSPFLIGVRGVEQSARGFSHPSYPAPVATPHAVHADGSFVKVAGTAVTNADTARWAGESAGYAVPAIEYDGSRVVPAALWSAVVDHFPLEERVNAIRVGRCENRKFDPLLVIIDVDGLPRKGQWMVGERWWGTVPDTFDGQAEQVAGIVDEHGWSPWTCAD